MASAQSSPKQKGLMRGKAILIAVLAVVLVVILYVQFGSAGAKANSALANRTPGRQAAPQSAETTAKPGAVTNAKTSGAKDMVAAPLIDTTHWKSPELTAVVAYDPFALPHTFPQPAKAATDTKSAAADKLIAAAAADDAKKLAEAVEKLRMQLKELEERGVHVIIRERDQYAAMIGDRMLHVGDEINGFTVTAIDPSGVSVERKKSP